MSEHGTEHNRRELEELDADDLATLDDEPHADVPLADEALDVADLDDEDDDLDEDDDDDLDDDEDEDDLDDEDDDDLDDDGEDEDEDDDVVDDDDDEEDDDDLDDDDDDDLEDATDDEIDLVVAMYREDGQPVAESLPKPLANDLDELINQLRRLPGDGGVLGFVSVAGEFFVIVRVRGRVVQVLLSDAVSANDWPLARDVVDFLGLEVPDPDDDSEPVGDMSMLSDQGLSDFDLEGYASDLEEDSDELLQQIAERIRMGGQFRRAVATPHR